MKTKTIPLVKIILSCILYTVSVLIFMLANQQRQQYLAPHAWVTEQSATAVCSSSDTVQIQVSFTNKEPNQQKNAMKVTARDVPSGKTTDLGVVQPGQTATGVIETNERQVKKGTVRFTLTWADGRSGQDSRTVTYQALECKPTITPTATPTKEPSPTKTPTPTSEVTKTPTPTDEPTPSPSRSPTSSPTPTLTPTTPPPTVTTTPAATPTITPSATPTLTPTMTPTITPTITQQPTYTPFPTYTPIPTTTDAPTPTPTEIIIALNNTNTPTPFTTEQVPTVPAAGIPLAWFVVLIPLILVITGFIL